MGRRSFNRVCAIHYPSRVEGWLDVCESEGELTRKHKTLPWSPLYCVLQQDEQSFTAYCSEEISIFPATPKKELTDVLFNEYPRVRLDRVRRPAKSLWDGPPTLPEEPEDSDTCPMDIALNTTLYSELASDTPKSVQIKVS
ncbi:ras GTPase-activating protein raskol [Zeugodacus cucurbitae]|uniref:ras GTPase-activating protein raskol n=1 Tax=Zeugodacus cucurbitae TaxID=28588 RepID=UPI0005969CBE|nr:ras GTPase-activating protein raskol [Zeugodacus cucurbitae]